MKVSDVIERLKELDPDREILMGVGETDFVKDFSLPYKDDIVKIKYHKSTGWHEIMYEGYDGEFDQEVYYIGDET